MDMISVSFASILSMLALSGMVSNDKAETQIAKISTHSLPIIYGQWQLKLNKTDPSQASCQERYNFGRNQQFIGQSGGEMTYGKYLFSNTSNGLPAIAIQTVYDNNLVDCSGNQIDQAGDMLVAYVKYEGNVMHWCRDDAGKQCSMTLFRVLP